MNKRSFLKATGLTFIASILALGRRGDNGASVVSSAQDNGDLLLQIAELRKSYGVIENRCRQYENETKTLKATLDSINSTFIGSVVAIPYGAYGDEEHPIPHGWHLCDGTEIPSDKEYEILKTLTGLTHFPDYRGVFLRGLDEKTQDGAGEPTWRDLGSTVMDESDKEHPKPVDLARKVNEKQTAEVESHSHDCKGVDGKGDGMHTHKIEDMDVGRIYPSEVTEEFKVNGFDRSKPFKGKDPDGNGLWKKSARTIQLETIYAARVHPVPNSFHGDKLDELERNGMGYNAWGFYDKKKPEFKPISGVLPEAPYPHHHDIKEEDETSKHSHSIAAYGGKETRPVNVSVRYIIKYM